MGVSIASCVLCRWANPSMILSIRCLPATAAATTTTTTTTQYAIIQLRHVASVAGHVSKWDGLKRSCNAYADEFIVATDNKYGNKQVISVTPRLYDYLLSNVREPEILRQLREETAAMRGSQMQVSPDQAQLLAMLIQILGAERCIEVGVYTFVCSSKMSSSGTPNESTPTPTSSTATPNSSSTQAAVRGKTDPAWEHCREDVVPSKKGRNLICLYCQKVIKGGGINRFKQHLAGIKGAIERCTRCPPDVSLKMKLLLETVGNKKRKTQEDYEELNQYGPEFRQYEEHEYMQENDDVQELPSSFKGKGIFIGGSRGKSTTKMDGARKGQTIGSFFVPRTTPGAQPTIKSVLQSKEAKERCDLAISKWMIDACIPFNAVNSKYYQPMLDAVTGYGGGYKGPNFHDIRGYLLNKNVEEVKNFVHMFKTFFHMPRFATNFIALQSILTQKDALRAMVTSREWTGSAYAKESKGKKFVDSVLDSRFWKECAIIVQLTEPLVRVLRIVDSDDRPSMGYLYMAMHTAREELLRRFQKKKKRVDVYLKIIDSRWDRQLHKNLHAAGYWLNPSNQYNTVEMEKHRQTISGLLDVIESYAYGNPILRSKLTNEMKLFRNAEGDFGRVTAISDRHTMLPDEWWLCYGSSAPTLQKLAIRVLSQTCSSSGCERNWSAFEHIHSKKRNRLEHQRLNDLVYVHYNLRLQQRNYLRGRNYDPIDFEDFTSNASWILEDEPPSLTIDEVESFRRELAACNIQPNLNTDEILNFELDDDDDDLEHEEGNGSGGFGNATTVENINRVGAENPEFGVDWSSWSRSTRWENENE